MTHLLRSILVVGIFGACIVSCSKPHDKVIPLDKKKWDTELRPIIERLSDEDRQYLTRYLVRLAPGSDAGKNSVPPGTTIGEAISEQRTFEAQQRQFSREAEIEAQRHALAQQEKLRRQEQANAEARQRKEQELQSVKAQLPPIVVKLVERHRPAGTLAVELTFLVANHGEKELQALKGVLRVTDAVNDTIAHTEIVIAGPIPPKASIQTKARFGFWYYTSRPISDRMMEEDIGLALDLSKVIFSDGSELSLPERELSSELLR